MKTLVLSKAEVDELCQIMTVGNVALKRSAEMLGLEHGEFRGLLFDSKDRASKKNILDPYISKLTPEQKQAFDEAIPLIMTVRDKCEAKLRAAFYPMIVKQAKAAANRMNDPHDAYQDFVQDGEMGVLDATYSYEIGKGTQLKSYVWRCIRRKIVGDINRMNPFCPLTNEAVDIIRRVEEERAKHDRISDVEIIELLGLTPDEREVYFGAITKVVNEASDEEMHADDYTSNRRGVDGDIKEIFFIREDVRQAVKDADLDEFELTCYMNDLFPCHGWKSDVAKNFTNERTGEKYTRQNIQYVLERAKKKVKDAFSNPPAKHKENPLIDRLFDEWNGYYED
jgi:DNA-directed RNA polymerase specialized sigma subunit